MSCRYSYAEIFELYGSTIRDLLINDPTRPYPIYETLAQYNGDTINHYKGLVIWDAQKYYFNTVYSGEGSSSGSGSIYDEYENKIGFFVIPEFGTVDIKPNYEYREIFTISFDDNTEPDYDPYGTKIVKVIDWFINAHKQAIECSINPLLTPSGTILYANVQNISRPIFNTNYSIYVRRTVTIAIRYCVCIGCTP